MSERPTKRFKVSMEFEAREIVDEGELLTILRYGLDFKRITLLNFAVTFIGYENPPINKEDL